MDYRLKYTIDYAQQELSEIKEEVNKGNLDDKGVFIRLFVLGKLLSGWDDNEGTEQEQINKLIETNKMVMDFIDGIPQQNAS